MTYTNALALAVLIAVPVAVRTLAPHPIAWLRHVRARRRAAEARLVSTVRRVGLDGWQAQDASGLWTRGVDR